MSGMCLVSSQSQHVRVAVLVLRFIKCLCKLGVDITFRNLKKGCYLLVRCINFYIQLAHIISMAYGKINNPYNAFYVVHSRTTFMKEALLFYNRRFIVRHEQFYVKYRTDSRIRTQHVSKMKCKRIHTHTWLTIHNILERC